MSRYRSDLHQTRLAQWAVQQFGRALVISLGIAGLLAGVSALSDDLAWSYIALIAGPLAFGLTLWSATAPLPFTDEELDVHEDEE